MIVKIIGLIFSLAVFLPNLRLTHILTGMGVIVMLILAGFFYEKLKVLRATLVIVFIVSTVKVFSQFFGFYYPFDALGIFVILAMYYVGFDLEHIRQYLLKRPKSRWFKSFCVYTLSSIIGLVTYAYFSKNTGLTESLKGMGLLSLISIGVVFSILNAFYEEFLFRECLATSLTNYCSNNLAIIVQACAFAVMHYAGGFPGGVSGLILTFVYGVFMGHLFIKFRSIWPCVLSHVVCDASVFSLILIKQLNP